MLRRIGSWLRRRPGDEGRHTPDQWTGERARFPKPIFDRALRRAPQDWPGAGQLVSRKAPRLSWCKGWVYQLQDINWERLEASVADVAVVDLTSTGPGGQGFTTGQIERMKARPGGGTTHLLCYLSIAAAEPWRRYWNPKWNRSQPDWMTTSHGEWAGSQLTHYWHPEWQSVLIDRPDSILNQIVAAGFDGVVLDGVDAFEHFRAQGRSSSADEMIDLVSRVGSHVWQSLPGFLVVPLNGEELLGSPRYRSVISAQIREDVLFRPDYGSGRESVIENNEKIVSAVMSDLGLALADGLPVLTVEYLRDNSDDEGRIADVARRSRALGLSPYFAPRRLNRLYPAV